jgi:hypothetical protein
MRVHRLLAAAGKSARMRSDSRIQWPRPARRPAGWFQRIGAALQRAALQRRVRELDRAIAQATIALHEAERHSWMALKRQAAECSRLCIARAALRARLEGSRPSLRSADGNDDPRHGPAGRPDTPLEAVRRANRR